MKYDNNLIASKLRRWDKYIADYTLPNWDDIPNFGLYMEQVIILLNQYVDYLPPELKDEQVVTPSAINNYVRTKIMPEPIKKKYYRIHIAYLIIICTMKQTLSIALLQKLMPVGIDEEEVRNVYEGYVVRHKKTTMYFANQVRIAAGPILGNEENEELSTEETIDIIFSAAITGGFAKLLAEKLLLLEGRDNEDCNKEETDNNGPDETASDIE